MQSNNNFSWWQSGIIYEAYVRSFQDTNGDGIGDINGVRQRLDYLQWLGIDILWLNPVYKSPQIEFGYDIADYTSVDPLFGTMEEFDRLLAEAHERGIRIVMDIAPNHSSDQHEWFKESRSSKDNPKRDWYIWKDPSPEGGPPNNWVSAFGGESAWELDPATGQYYYHAFLKEQPDLNWRNPDVEKAIFEAMRFWLDRGIDGFRVDVMWHHIKDNKFRDNPFNPDFDPEKDPANNKLHEVYSANRPETVKLVTDMRDVLQEYEDERLLIGELYQSGTDLVNYYGPGCEGAQIPHNQQLILIPWEAPKVRDAIEQYEGSIPQTCWPNWVMGNHDKPRVATRVGSQVQARVARMMLLTLRGTPTLYYGDEVGMENVEIPDEKLKDPFEKLDPGKGQGRDPQRTPMQWTPEEENAGFTTGDPWLPLDKNWREINVEAQKKDPRSMLMLTKRLIELRRRHPALSVGEHRLVLTDVKGPVVAYRRLHESGNFLVALNLSSDRVTFDLSYGYRHLKSVLSTIPGTEEGEYRDQVTLRPDEGLLLQVL